MIKQSTFQKMSSFTFMEMIVVITIISIIISSAAMIFSHGSTGYFTDQQSNGLSIEAEQAINQLSKELRMARSINGVSSSQLSFTNQAGNSIIYSLSGTNLLRSHDGVNTTNISSDHTSSFAVSYFDSALATTATAANVRLVNIDLNFIDGESNLRLVQSIFLRSLI